jgi:hypothetical protein
MNLAIYVQSLHSCIPHDGKCSIVQLACTTLLIRQRNLLIFMEKKVCKKLAHGVQYS